MYTFEKSLFLKHAQILQGEGDVLFKHQTFPHLGLIHTVHFPIGYSVIVYPLPHAGVG